MDMGRGSHAAGCLDSASRDQKRGLRSGERSNRLPCANHGRDCFRIHVAATLPVDSAGELCKLGLAFAGLAIGVTAALILTRLLLSFSHLLYGVGASDPATLVCVSAVLIGV